MKQHTSIITLTGILDNPHKSTASQDTCIRIKKKIVFFFFFFFFFLGKSFLNYQTFNRDNILHKLIKKL